MTKLYLYCDHAGSYPPSKEAEEFIRKVEQAGDDTHGFVRDGDEWTPEKLIDLLLMDEDRPSVRDNFLGVLSSALCGEVDAVCVLENDAFLISRADLGPQVVVPHDTHFRHFNEPDYHGNYVPLLHSPLNEAVERSCIGFLVSPAEGGGFRYDVYARQGDDYAKIAETVLPKRLSSWCAYDILGHFARNDILDEEIGTVMGKDWKSLLEDENAPAPAH